MSFSQNDSPEQYQKSLFSKKSDDKTFKEIIKFRWATISVVQENQNVATFIP